MSASDHINGILFHGSNHLFSPGDLVIPREAERGEYPEPGISYATPDKNLAKRFGKHIFQVEPIDREKTYAHKYTDTAYEVLSPVGFKVLNKVEE
jgi:hypothetical protein